MSKPISNTAKITAIQWFENGDHPLDGDKDKEGKVVGYFTHPDMPEGMQCEECGHMMNDHGFIRSTSGDQLVCVGNFIVSNEKGEYFSYRPNDYYEIYGKDN